MAPFQPPWSRDLTGNRSGTIRTSLNASSRRRNSPLLNFIKTGAVSCSSPTFISFATRFQYTPALVDQPFGVRSVLNDSMRVHEVEPIVGKRQVLAIGDFEMASKCLLCEVGARELDGGRCDVDAGDIGSAFRKTGKVDGGPATDVENRTPAVAVKVDEPEQVVQLLEMIPVEIVEELARTGRMPGNLQIMDMRVPVRTDILDRRHSAHYSCNAAARDAPHDDDA
jgi:hypothetical protein